MTTQKMNRAWLAFKVARDARDAAQREYDKTWAVYSELDDANESERASFAICHWCEDDDDA